jgi:rod shape-determining protein MreD
MSVILSIPTLGLIAILQSAVVSRLPLNRGIADLVLVVLVAIALQKTVTTSWQWSIVGGLFMDFLSGLPFGIFTVSYLLATGLALIIRDRIWRFSFLMQLLVVLFGTMFSHTLSFIVLFLQGSDISLGTVLQVVTLPSVILNFMISLPIFILTQDILEQVNPQE